MDTFTDAIDFKVQVARMEERQKVMLELSSAMAEKLEEIEERLTKVLLDAEGYKNDKRWIIGVFGALWGATMIYMEYKLKS